MLSVYRKKIIQESILLNDTFNYDYLKLKNKRVYYKDIRAKKIIFCEGPKVANNPYFKLLPFTFTKGELLVIRAKLKLKKIINSSFFILPIGNDVFVIGSTYDWTKRNYKPTHSAKKQLLSKFKKISSCKFEIIDHKASIRPTTVDRRPIIGWHDQYKEIGIFNGLGSRGLIMAPYLANMFCDNYIKGLPILKEASIDRFNK